MLDLRRRGFITLLGGAAAAWPLAARAQQPAMPVMGFLGSGALTDRTDRMTAFRQGLKEAGFIEDQNVPISTGSEPIMKTVGMMLVADLAGNATGLPAATKTATQRCTNSRASAGRRSYWSSAQRYSIASGLNRPGGNLTGVAYLNVEVAPKRLELLHEFVPAARRFALMVNPASPPAAEGQVKELQAAVRTLGLDLKVLNARNPIEIEDAFETLVRDRIEALQIGVDPLFGNHVDQLVALATRHKVPTIYPWREFTAAGGLMNYGSSIPDAFRQVGIYTGQILKGAKPADLPIWRPTALRFVINLKATKALGIEAPPKLLALADELIE
jgi:putative tryptophan/tyrosine transport system substrate-binding protein